MKKKIIKISLISLSVAFVLFIVLVAHIYIVTKPKPRTTPMVQLSRIDFKEKPDSIEASKIVSFVRHLDGIDNAYFNIPDGIFVFGFYREKQSSKNVYDELMKLGHYNAKPFVVDLSTAAKGCPVMDKNSFGYRMSTVISKIFN